jgi:thioesterase domain-containing protein
MTQNGTPAGAPAPEVIAEFPTSTTQQRCWFLDQLNPGNPALNVAVRWELRGKVSAASVERAFRHVIERHEVLRTRLVEREGMPVQEVVSQVDFKLGLIDIAATAETDHAERIDAIAHENAEQPFDLTKPGLIRATLVRFAPDRAMLLIVVHQSCFDGYSIGVLGEEIGAATAAFEAGRQPELPELPLQYGDFCLWQQEYLASGVLDEETAYWTEALRDAPYFEADPDKPRPAQRGTGVAQADLKLPEGFHDRLVEAAKAQGVSPFTYGTALVGACLHRLTGASEVLMGTQVAGRTEVDLEPLIGVFINNLVLRLNTAADMRFSEQLAQARQVVEGALSHQSMPFNTLVEKLNPVRDASRNPLISINFLLQHVFLKGKSYGDFELISVPSHAPGAVYDLSFIVIGRPETGWKVSCEYATELFERSTIDRLLEMIRDGFDRVMERPELRLGDLPLDPQLAKRQDRNSRALKRIEEALCSHPQVREAAAIRSGTGFYAFVVPGATGVTPLETLPAELMEFASRKLAAEEMPAGISILVDFPRSSRGEINRAVLSVPPHATSRPPARAGAAGRRVEARLAEHWRDILAIEEVPPHATFFELGGHSLLAVRLLTRIRQDWKLELGVAAIYEHATLPALARLIAGQIAGEDAAPEEEAEDWRILPLARDGGGVPLIAVNNVGITLATLGKMTTPRQASCVRLFDGTRGIDQSERSFEEIATEYAKVVRKLQPHGPYMFFGVCVHGNIALETARILQAEGEEIAAVVLKDVWEPGYVERLKADPYRRWLERLAALRNRMRLVREGRLSLPAMLGNYRIVRYTGVLQLAQKLGLIDRVRKADLTEEQEGFIAYISRARNVYRPAPIAAPVLHVITRITPRGRAFAPSIGWEEVVTGPLKTVYIEDVAVQEGVEYGTAELAREIESFLAERAAEPDQ